MHPVPTPGQTEQEYLANYLFSKRFAFTAKQENFKLGACLDAAAGFPFVKYEEEKKNHLQEAVSELLNALPVPKEPGLTTPPNHKSLG